MISLMGHFSEQRLHDSVERSKNSPSWHSRAEAVAKERKDRRARGSRWIDILVVFLNWFSCISWVILGKWIVMGMEFAEMNKYKYEYNH